MAESSENLYSDAEKSKFGTSDTSIKSSYSFDEDSFASASIEGSVVASPSIESFSTLPEGESSISLTEGGGDLVVRVDNPQKQADLLETYITFRVCTKTSREQFQGEAFSVRRRYNDFIWLRQHLVSSHPTHFVPALPGKHTIIGQFDRYGREFVTSRMAALQVFLNRIIAHPILGFAECFKAFLTLNYEDFLELRKLSSPGLLSKVSDSWKSLSTLHIEPHRPPELNKLYDNLTELSDKLNHLLRINQRIRRERCEQAKDLNELKPTFEKWAGSEPDLTNELCCVANAVGKCEEGLHSILIDNENILISQPLKEYVLYVDAIKETLNRRDELEVDLLYRRELLEKKREELLSMQEGEEGGSGGSGGGGGLRAWVRTFETKEDRQQRLTQAVSLAQTSLEEARDKLECANENIRADMERWKLEKQADVKNILLAFTDQHIHYYQQCGDAWKAVLSELAKGDAPSAAPSSASTEENTPSQC